MTDPRRSRIGVLLVDDHRMFGESLAPLCCDEGDIDVLGIATSGPAAAISMAASLHPRVVLADHEIPDQNGVSVATELRDSDPEIMVVTLTGSTDDRVLLAAIDAGCSGFLAKDRAASEVAAAGEALISPVQLARLLPKLNRTRRSLGSELTDREGEIQVPTFLVRGCSNKVVTSEIHLSLNTIRNYVQSMLAKRGAHSKLEAVSTAVREVIVSYP